MKRGIVLLWGLLLPLLANGRAPADTLRVLFWNVENFFDTRDGGGGAADTEFSARGERHWSRKKFQAKCNAIAKTHLWVADEGGLPDVVGLAEVENAFVLRRLLETTALRKLDYQVVHFDSPDPRGIDVALLYRSSTLTFVDAKPLHLYKADSTVMSTRDILLTHFRTKEGADVVFLVNHHPSKYGGTDVSEPRRKTAVLRLRQVADSLKSIGLTQIVAMGDFNDTPDNEVFILLEPTLRNLAEPLHLQGEGTIKYEGKWELIDMFFASPETRTGPMRILHPPFLEAPDKAHAGTKPLRTWSGPRYLGGVSDHCPILLEYMAPTDSSLRSE